MNSLLLLFLTAATQLAGAPVRVLAKEAVAVFGGGTRAIEVSVQNYADVGAELEVGWQLLQTSSATAAPFGPVTIWKRVAVAAHETVLDEVRIPLPSVRAETRFLVRFLEQKEVLGLAEIWVYPTNLLTEINDLLEGNAVILCEAPDVWKRALTAAGIQFFEASVGSAIPPRSKLVIVGPLADPATEAAAVATAWSWAKSGVAIILIKSASIPAAATEPSYYAFNASKATFVVAQTQAMTDLATNPWSQLRLLRMARLATGHELLALPKPSADQSTR